jgi:O-antigen ligase
MVQLSADLFFEKPLAGYGERGLSEQVLIDKYSSTYARQTLKDIAGAGPHNGLLDQTLENGIFGLTAALLLFLAPVLLVMRNLSRLTTNTAYENGLIPRIGLVYFLQVLAITFTSNPYGVRMFSALNALMLALLLAWCSRDVKEVST